MELVGFFVGGVVGGVVCGGGPAGVGEVGEVAGDEEEDGAEGG